MKKNHALMQLLTAAIVILLGIFSSELQSFSSANTRIAFLDVGQGDATYLQFTNGEDMLIDCSRGAQVLDALGRVMPAFDRTITYMVITHPDADHYAGCMDVLAGFDVEQIILTGVGKQNTLYTSFLGYVEKEYAEEMVIMEPREFILGEARLQVLYPDHNMQDDPLVPGSTSFDSNDTSIVMRVDVGDTSVLLTGDAESALETYLVETYAEKLDVDILKVGHHGSKTSSGASFLEAVSPEHAIISASKDNSYGHPARSVTDRLKKNGASVWQTAQKGDILLSIDIDSYDIQ
ncbi:MAG: MBL fold metallo-hydrolase [Candidatus Magasanikbacteria bacterium]|jgi:competence protein ComEC|nr:MBL fold metallo-hydrolase [Candidatus Magasanikbacteria bacterium]